MKLLSLFLIVSMLQVSATTVFSQKAKISLNLESAFLPDVLQEIENQSDYRFIYKDDLIDVNVLYNLNVENKKIDDVLNRLFENSNLTFRLLEDNLIVLAQKELLNQELVVKGTVTDTDGNPLPGVNILEKGTTNGAVTDLDGIYSLSVSSADATLVFSFIGFLKEEVPLSGQTTVDITLVEDIMALQEVVVVGYGTQKKSDITGAVASVSQERLQQVPNTNFAQALQGAVPGLTITTNGAGAEGNEMSILVRGRNSIEASNTPLIVLDGIPYSGSISEINPDDIESIEVLKDASSAAIYGARASNGVILVTTKRGKVGKPTINYNGYYGIQEIASVPDVLSGEEFWGFKSKRNPDDITDSEREIYESGEWTDWIDETTRTGKKQQHTLSLSGGTEKMKYFVSGTYLDVKGIAVSDDFQRYSSRFNFEADVTDWFSIGSNTQLSQTDRSGFTPSWSGGVDGAFYMNPLTKIRDEEGKSTVYPWPEDPYWGNPLANTLADNKDNSYKVFTNNYAVLKMPWIDGLQYRLNTGIEYTNRERNSYYGRDTKSGLEDGGRSDSRNRVDNDYIVENILSYTKDFGVHNIFATALYSYQQNTYEEHRIQAQGFPNDVLTWHQASTGNLVDPSSGFRSEKILSQMLRLNYGYDSRYLITVTGRRDGFSGFGSNTKWGVFPSVALGWNIANESFFSSVSFINQLKLRGSYGENGNQAVAPYKTLSRLSERSYLDGSATAPGYRPTALGNPDLGWETTKSMNIGLDFGFFENRIYGSIDMFNSDTYGLLLDRSISPVHGITSITENIGETNNKGVELMVTSYNLTTPDFKWTTSGTFSYNKNKIVSLYGYLDEDGNEIDDIGNRWFIGQPIRVNYGREFDGIWQTGDDIENSAQPDAIPGDAKIVDQNNDGVIDDDDRIIQGQRDPKFLWSLTNILTYKDFTLSFFIHGVNGVEKRNTLLSDNVWSSRRNTVGKNWWSEDNPSNEWIGNSEDNQTHGAIFVENASFIRLKDISLSYDIPGNIQSKIGFNKLRVYVTGRNLLTVTKYEGLDPELSSDRDIPLQKEFLVGVVLGF